MPSNTLRTAPDDSYIPYHTIWWQLIAFWVDLFEATAFGLAPDRTKRGANRRTGA
jgi:hypothetical protein